MSSTLQHLAPSSEYVAAPSFLGRPGRLERAAVTVALFTYAFSLPMDWFVRVNASSAGTVQGGSILTQLVFTSFLGLAILGLNGNWHVAMTAIGREPVIVSLLALMGLSTIWSNNVAETAQNFIVFSFTYVFAIYLTTRFDLPAILHMVGLSLAAGVFINFAFIFVFQDFGLDSINVGTDGGAKWSGIFVTKNELGRIASLSALIFTFLARLRHSKLIWPALTVLALSQVFGSDSATSLGATLGLIGLGVIFLTFRGRKTLYLSLIHI